MDAAILKQRQPARWALEDSTHHLDLEGLAAVSVGDLVEEVAAVGSAADSEVIAVVIVDLEDVAASDTKADAVGLVVSPMALVVDSLP